MVYSAPTSGSTEVTEPIAVKPVPLVSEIGLLRTPTAPMMKSALVVEIVVLAVTELPVFELGAVTSNGEAVFAPLMAKATTDDAEFPLRVTVIVIAPVVVFKAQNVCRVLRPLIAALAL